jgi:hypothetical protein
MEHDARDTRLPLTAEQREALEQGASALESRAAHIRRLALSFTDSRAIVRAAVDAEQAAAMIRRLLV